MSEINSYRDLMYAIAKRAKELGDLKMPELRSAAGFGCNTDWEAQQKSQGCSRGELIEEILTEEFDPEFDRDFEV